MKVLRNKLDSNVLCATHLLFEVVLLARAQTSATCLVTKFKCWERVTEQAVHMLLNGSLQLREGQRIRGDLVHGCGGSPATHSSSGRTDLVD